jgi:hypothetical protein
MDRACTADFMPELYHVGGARQWETECSYGLLSIAATALLIVFAVLAERYPSIVGWDWMSRRQRASMRAALAPAVLLSGIGTYHQDGGWMLVGLVLMIAIPVAWYLACRPPRSATGSGR